MTDARLTDTARDLDPDLDPEEPDEAPRPPRHPRLHRFAPPVAVALAALLAVGAPVSSAWANRTALQSTPAATVRDFLTSAVVDHDGVTAGHYLTPAARTSFEGADQRLTSDEIFFGDAQLRLGGENVVTNRELKELTYRVRDDGAARVVTVSHDGRSLRFRVVRANGGEQVEFQAPTTPWRVDSGVTALAAPGPAASTAV